MTVAEWVNVLLMKEGAQDFRSGQKYDHTVFFGENVDIHHIFPQKWCKDNGVKPQEYDSIINKTPLSFRTNRIIGGSAPSEYLAKLTKGSGKSPAIEKATLDSYLASHLVDADLLWADRFHEFMADRQKRLLALIERAMGKLAYAGPLQDEGDDAEGDDDAVESGLTIPAV